MGINTEAEYWNERYNYEQLAFDINNSHNNPSWEKCRPSSLYEPRLFIDGNKWCALYGDNLQDGVAGFGESPHLAYLDFDNNWHKKLGGGRG